MSTHVWDELQENFSSAPPSPVAVAQPMLSNPPRISVVVLTYRRPQLLARCLRSLCQQDIHPQAFEVIVVDDGHTADTQACVTKMAQQYPKHMLRYLRPLVGRGPAVARNAGWCASQAALIAFTDDDTLPYPDWLRQGEAAMRADSWAALAGRVEVPPLNPNLLDTAPTDHELMTQGLQKAEFVTANAFVWRSALQQVQGFDERFTRAWREDSDLQFRLMDQVGRVGRSESAIVIRPVRPERWGISLRQQKNAFFEALLYAKHPHRYRKNVGSPPWNYYTIVLLTLGAIVLAMMSQGFASALATVGAAALILQFAWSRLRFTSREPKHELEMLATSAVIPFLSVYWRLRGAWHFRVWFF